MKEFKKKVIPEVISFDAQGLHHYGKSSMFVIVCRGNPAVWDTAPREILPQKVFIAKILKDEG